MVNNQTKKRHRTVPKQINGVCRCGKKECLTYFKNEYLCRDCLCDDMPTEPKGFSMIYLCERENI